MSDMVTFKGLALWVTKYKNVSSINDSALIVFDEPIDGIEFGLASPSQFGTSGGAEFQKIEQYSMVEGRFYPDHKVAGRIVSITCIDKVY